MSVPVSKSKLVDLPFSFPWTNLVGLKTLPGYPDMWAGHVCFHKDLERHSFNVKKEAMSRRMKSISKWPFLAELCWTRLSRGLASRPLLLCAAGRKGAAVTAGTSGLWSGQLKVFSFSPAVWSLLRQRNNDFLTKYYRNTPFEPYSNSIVSDSSQEGKIIGKTNFNWE